jgi:uncharacterized membrane protein
MLERGLQVLVLLLVMIIFINIFLPENLRVLLSLLPVAVMQIDLVLHMVRDKEWRVGECSS